MKISCKIIEDLLPLYIDDVCSEESRRIVDEHLSECSKCSETLKQMKKENLPMENIELNLTEADPIRNLSKEWHKKLKKSMFKGVISTLLIVGAVLLIIYIFVGIKIVWK
ncbi:membrane protein [Streptococcus dysgalactiae subsp. equisimilis]|uniref:Anti-sigma-W factor RsiW n=1 Tax=Streptococcus dysgalactiae subsp. equisimilis TaxID=119602 RepID=A0A9X8T396_STREQ|nr:zf-HC2 domain-containing protein [Streptococcus dysgalactiae]SUN62481.1 membrane protein [Streptococcus dysgalactiae subsp. equisimilis]